MTVRVGTSGWNYPTGRGTWNGLFYPARRPRGFDELAYYAEHFDTVEVNSSFYRVPDPALAAAWLRRTPPGFEFAIKLYQKFTHPDMYVQRGGSGDWTITPEDVDEFRRGIDPIAAAARLTALLLQFPASFRADADNRDYVEWLLRAFCDYPLALELRHRSWSDAGAETRMLLDAYDAAWVYIDEPKFQDSIAQTFDSEPSGGTLIYVRFHGRNAAQWWQHEDADDRYDYLYRPEELQPFAAAAGAAATKGRKVAMYFNNHFSAKAVANAAVLRHQLGDLVPGTYERQMIERYPDLAGVVRSSGGRPI